MKCASVEASNFENSTCPIGLSGRTRSLSNSPFTIIVSKLFMEEKNIVAKPCVKASSPYRKAISPSVHPLMLLKRASITTKRPSWPT